MVIYIYIHQWFVIYSSLLGPSPWDVGLHPRWAERSEEPWHHLGIGGAVTRWTKWIDFTIVIEHISQLLEVITMVVPLNNPNCLDVLWFWWFLEKDDGKIVSFLRFLVIYCQYFLRIVSSSNQAWLAGNSRN